jgi:hypothetical protein
LPNAHAFWQVGKIAPVRRYCGVRRGVAFPVLSIIGFLHMRRTPAEAELQPR